MQTGMHNVVFWPLSCVLMFSCHVDEGMMSEGNACLTPAGFSLRLAHALEVQQKAHHCARTSQL